MSKTDFVRRIHIRTYFPLNNLYKLPIRTQWIHGSGENRPVTWRYEIDCEPPQYRNDLVGTIGLDLLYK